MAVVAAHVGQARSLVIQGVVRMEILAQCDCHVARRDSYSIRACLVVGPAVVDTMVAPGVGQGHEYTTDHGCNGCRHWDGLVGELELSRIPSWNYSWSDLEPEARLKSRCHEGGASFETADGTLDCWRRDFERHLVAFGLGVHRNNAAAKLAAWVPMVVAVPRWAEEVEDMAGVHSRGFHIARGEVARAGRAQLGSLRKTWWINWPVCKLPDARSSASIES